MSKYIECDRCEGPYPVAAEPKGEWLVRTDTNDRTAIWLCYWCARSETITRDAKDRMELIAELQRQIEEATKPVPFRPVVVPKEE